MNPPLARLVQKPARYVPAISTDISKTIARAKKALAGQQVVVRVTRNAKEAS